MAAKWTDEDSALLREMAGSSSLKEMAEAVGRTPAATRFQCRKLGVKPKDTRGAARSVWTEDRLEWLAEELKTKPLSQVAAEAGVNPRSIQSAVEDYGVKRMSREDANRTEWRRARLSETLLAKSAIKYPPDGPWECVTCHQSKSVSEFPANKRVTHQCYTCQHAAHVARTYGITIEQYMERYVAQDGKCAMCKKPEDAVHKGTGRVYMLSVDHDHACCPGKKSCGKCVRGLLCRECNHGIGKLESRGVTVRY